MGHTKRSRNLRSEIRYALTQKKAFGRSKYQDKEAGVAKDGVYSYQTMKNYIQSAERFAAWATGKAKTMAEAADLVPKYLQERIDAGYSPYSVRLDAAALAKAYGLTGRDDLWMEIWKVDFPAEHRANITQHRSGMPEGFSVEKNADLIDFCTACGVRRHELLQLRPCDVGQVDGVTVLRVAQGKGGKSRIVTCLNDVPYQMAQAAAAAGKERIFDKIPNRAPIHQLRREYAQQLYMRLSRPVDTLAPEQCYYCRNDMQGNRFDRHAMQIVSKNLGHNRLGVVTHYLL